MTETVLHDLFRDVLNNLSIRRKLLLNTWPKNAKSKSFKFFKYSDAPHINSDDNRIIQNDFKNFLEFILIINN